MNPRRGLLWLWLIFSALWLIGWTLVVRQHCHVQAGGTFWCQHERAGMQALFGQFASWTPLQVYLLGLVIPLAVLILGLAVVAAVSIWKRKSG